MVVERASDLWRSRYADAGVTVHELGGRTSTSMVYWAGFPAYLRRDRRALSRLFEGQDAIVTSFFPMPYLASSLVSEGVPHVSLCFEPFPFFHDDEVIDLYPRPKRMLSADAGGLYGRLDQKGILAADRLLTLEHRDGSPDRPRLRARGRRTRVCRRGLLRVLPTQRRRCRRSAETVSVQVPSSSHSTDFSPIKRTDLAIEAFAVAARRVPNARLLITSTHEDSRQLKVLMQRASELGVDDRDRLLGFIPFSDVPRIYSLANVLLQTGTSATSGATACRFRSRKRWRAAPPWSGRRRLTRTSWMGSAALGRSARHHHHGRAGGGALADSSVADADGCQRRATHRGDLQLGRCRRARHEGCRQVTRTPGARHGCVRLRRSAPVSAARRGRVRRDGHFNANEPAISGVRLEQVALDDRDLFERWPLSRPHLRATTSLPSSTPSRRRIGWTSSGRTRWARCPCSRRFEVSPPSNVSCRAAALRLRANRSWAGPRVDPAAARDELRLLEGCDGGDRAPVVQGDGRRRRRSPGHSSTPGRDTSAATRCPSGLQRWLRARPLSRSATCRSSVTTSTSETSPWLTRCWPRRVVRRVLQRGERPPSLDAVSPGRPGGCFRPGGRRSRWIPAGTAASTSRSSWRTSARSSPTPPGDRPSRCLRPSATWRRGHGSARWMRPRRSVTVDLRRARDTRRRPGRYRPSGRSPRTTRAHGSGDVEHFPRSTVRPVAVPLHGALESGGGGDHVCELPDGDLSSTPDVDVLVVVVRVEEDLAGPGEVVDVEELTQGCSRPPVRQGARPVSDAST